MNIGPILRGAMGKSAPAESKTLELRTGQVVRGTVLGVSEDGAEAVVEVQGVKLKAALESPLQQGQSMLMQVQPPGQEGLVVLRPLPGAPGTSAGEKGLEQLLKNAGLENTPDNRELVQLMQSAGIEVNKSNTAALIKTLGAKPAGVPLAEWVNAAAIALQRGLSLSGDIVGGLHQAVFGPPVHVLFTALEEQLAALLDAPGAFDASGISGGTVEAGQMEKAQQNAAAPAFGSAGAAGGGPGGAASAGEAPAGAAEQNAAPRAGGAVSGSAAPGLDALLRRLQSVLGELRAELAAGQGGSRAGAPGAGSAAAATQAAGSAAADGTAAGEAAPLPQGGAAQAASSQGTESWLSRVLKLLGAEHEQQAGRALAMAPAPGAGGPVPPASAAEPEQAEGSGASQTGAGPAGGSAAQAEGAAPSTANGSALAAGQGNAAGAGAPASAGSAAEGSAAGAAASAAGSPGSAGGSAAGAALGNTAAADDAGGQAAGHPADTARGGAASGSEAVQAGQARGLEQTLSDQGRLPGSGFLPPANAATGSLLHELQEAAADLAAARTPGQADSAAASVKDNLKSVLLQIMNTPEAPAQLQESARQMVQQLTGQQLLLNTDRTAPFAQVTMFLPFKGPEGDETATVQIQSRRGKRGELDPNNCRLWFDLNMSALGKLMVDVQVSDKKVLLQIHSESDEVGQYLERRGDEIDEAVKAAGYRLVALRTDTYQAPEDKQEEQVSQSGAFSYVPPAYRGVDYRI